MSGSISPIISNSSVISTVKKYSRAKLLTYDQQRMVEMGTINSILYKPKSFMRQRKCQKQNQWFQQYFNQQGAINQKQQLIQYYRYYRNSPLVVDLKFMEVMFGYWNRKKTLYYKQIKRQLQLQEQSQSQITPQGKLESCSKSKNQQTMFQLPSHLQSIRTTFLNDPDATLRNLLTTMNAKNIKEQTREASRIQEFQQKSPKSNTKVNHLRTNPSQFDSCSSFKKQKRKNTHKSHSNQSHRSPSPQRKLNNFVGNKKVNTKTSETTLNYQRRNKQVKPKKKQIKDVRSSNREGSTGKRKSCQKSQGKVLIKKVSSGKLKQVQSTKVKAAITKVRDKIKAEKNIAIKKYMMQRQSFLKSTDNKHVQMRRSRK